MGSLGEYLELLAATLVLELPIALWLAPRDRRCNTLLAALSLNLLTHPLASALGWLADASWLTLELAVTLSEAAGYRLLVGLSWRRAVALALVANVCSALAGITLVAIGSAACAPVRAAGRVSIPVAPRQTPRLSSGGEKGAAAPVAGRCGGYLASPASRESSASPARTNPRRTGCAA